MVCRQPSGAQQETLEKARARATPIVEDGQRIARGVSVPDVGYNPSYDRLHNASLPRRPAHQLSSEPWTQCPDGLTVSSLDRVEEAVVDFLRN